MINFIKLLRFNFFSKNIIRHKGFIIPHQGVYMELSKSSTIEINGNVHLGRKHYLAKRKITSVILKDNSKLIFNSSFEVSQGACFCVNHGGEITLNGGSIGSDSLLNCSEKIIIGDKFLCSREVIIRDNDGHVVLSPNYQKSKPIQIGSNVWLCERCAILKGAQIGSHCVIAFGAIFSGTLENNRMYISKHEKFSQEIEGFQE